MKPTEQRKKTTTKRNKEKMKNNHKYILTSLLEYQHYSTASLLSVVMTSCMQAHQQHLYEAQTHKAIQSHCIHADTPESQMRPHTHTEP